MSRRLLRSCLGVRWSAALLLAVGVVGCDVGVIHDAVSGPDGRRGDAGDLHDEDHEDVDASTTASDDAGLDAAVDDASLDTDAGLAADGGADAAVPFVDPSLAAEALFAPDGIARIELTVEQTELDALAVDPHSYVHGALTIELADARVFTLADIGVRLKGKLGSARTLDKKAAFLLKLNEYVEGQKLLGLTKLALNNMVQDPSMVHEQLAYALFREAGVPAPRTSYARVFVNDTLFGLYASIEVVDNSELLTHWYGDADGNLYEGAYGSDLHAALLGSFDQDRGPDLGFADLQELITALDGFTAPAQFMTHANTVVDMGRFVQFAATEIYIGHWDGYAWTRNNYHLYRHAEGRWTFMPWGLDQTFASNLDPFGGAGRVQQMCAASLPCRAELANAFEQVAARVEDLELAARVDSLRTLIEDAMQEDPRKEYSADAVHAAMDATKAFLAGRESQVSSRLLACTDPSDTDVDGDGSSGCGADCNDQDMNVHPGAAESCNMKDDDCDGQLDEDPLCPSCVTKAAVGGGTYAYCFRSKSYADAEADCVAKGGHLASIHSQAQQDEITTSAAGVLNAAWSIGISDAAVEGSFTWVDGTPVDFQKWNAGEPNDAGGEDCTQIVPGSWVWNDVGCGTSQPYVCKLP